MNRREALKRVAALVGGTLSIPTVAAALSGCQPSGSGSLMTFTADQAELVATIAERIIPATDTPGARAAGVHRFIDLILAETALPEDRERFLAGLDAVDAQCEEDYGQPFLACTPEEQNDLLTQWDEAAFGNGASSSPDTPPFFQMMKELTLVGYYTSEIGATQELRFDPVMGRYDPCVPFDEIGRAWA